MNLNERDSKVIWHPFTQMKGAKIIPIVKGEGVYLFDENGNKYIDAVSSWWVNVHGHCHPHIQKAINNQFAELEHVIFAGFTHPQAVMAGERLVNVLPDPIKRVFYSDNGSTSVEVGIKMALQYWWNQGAKRDTIIAFEGAYHGDTFGSMSVSSRTSFTEPFERHLFQVEKIPTPCESDSRRVIDRFKSVIAESSVAAFIYEPLIQGVRGMVMYDGSILDELLSVCKEHEIITIADEVMCGFGRTGTMFASEQLTNSPDIMCLSKGLTGGAMALGVTATSERIYNGFYLDEREKAFLHGHSFAGNPLACAAVNANLDLFEKEETKTNIRRICNQQAEFANRIAQNKLVEEARVLGTILAIELATIDGASYFSTKGTDAYEYFLSKGIVMRPLGNVLIVMPPYCISNEDLGYVHSAITSYLK